MPKMVKAYTGRHYSVNCKHNDSVDIKGKNNEQIKT